MSEALILEFRDATADLYYAVDRMLGLDPDTGEGDWPAGLLHHVGTATDHSGVVVMEIWDSRESQGAFMASRLGPALDKVGLPEPTRVEWLPILGQHHVG